MKTFATVVLAGCLLVVIALQVLVLRNQNHPESAVRIQSIDRNYPHIELASYSVAEEQGEAATRTESAAIEFETSVIDGQSEPMFEADSFEEPEIVTPLSTAVDLPPTLVPAESESALSLLDAESELGLSFGPEDNAKPQPARLEEFSPPASSEELSTGFDLTEGAPEPAKVITGPTAENTLPPNQPFNPSAAPTESVAQAQPEKDQPPSPLAHYPIWLLIKPDGVQFLQTPEEIALHQNTIPANAFLLGCVTVDFAGAAVEQKPDFQLSCEDFLVMGRYGTQQHLEVKGASLSYSTASQQVQLEGSEELPLEFESRDATSETRLQADKITLQLHENSFQVSAKGTTTLEINANPEPVKPTKPSSNKRGFDPFPAGENLSGDDTSPFG